MEERTSARSKGTNRVEVPEARGALDRFKFEVANEIGVDLKEGYNGHLTTAQAGSVGLRNCVAMKQSSNIIRFQKEAVKV